MGFLIFLGGAMLGGFLGIGFMCCFQINRINEQMKNTDEKKDLAELMISQENQLENCSSKSLPP